MNALPYEDVFSWMTNDIDMTFGAAVIVPGKLCQGSLISLLDYAEKHESRFWNSERDKLEGMNLKDTRERCDFRLAIPLSGIAC